MNLKTLPTPCYVVDRARIRANCSILQQVQDRTHCRILLALKSFAMFSLFSEIRPYLHGTCASGINEALLGHELFGKEVHVYSPAFSQHEMRRLLPIAHHISFNSLHQWETFRGMIQECPRHIACGLRINPEYSEVATELYNPCSKGSRLGIRAVDLEGFDFANSGLSGLHFHTMCEQNSDVLERTLPVVEEKFGHLFRHLSWINFGGGHHITRSDYDVDLLCRLISSFQERYPSLTIYLEPGEAIALNTGVLVTEVMDIVRNEVDIAILDTSATAHMPDVLEMPYRPEVRGAVLPGSTKEHIHVYRLAGPTCLAGDVVGDYAFKTPLERGQRLVFGDMAHYTMVKNTTFNGVPLPSIAIYNPDQGTIEVVRKFGYEDYRNRLS